MNTKNENVNDASREEYEMQHFGFTSNEAAKDFNTMFSNIVRKEINGMVKVLNNCNKKKIDENIIDAAYANFIKHFDTAFEEINDVFLLVFKIPDNLLLNSDHVQDYEIKDEDLIQIKQDITNLEREYLANKIVVLKLKDELNKLKQLKKITDFTNEILNDAETLTCEMNKTKFKIRHKNSYFDN